MSEIKAQRWVLTLATFIITILRLSQGTDKIKLVFYEPRKEKTGVLTRAFAFCLYLVASSYSFSLLIPFIK